MTDSSGKSTEKTDISRRSYLTATAGLTGLSVVGATVSGSESDYEVITVPAGETYRVNLSDGETFENVLFDISARDARAQIRARANDWTIRNVGWVGRWDSRSDSWHPIVCDVPNPNSEGLVENVCFETTTASDDPYGNGPGGPYVYRQHAGHITFDRVYLQHFQDNGFYCSSPGRDEGGEGTIEIRNSYAYRCGISNFRLGRGGELHNCVGVEGHRNFWVQFNEADAYDCDFIDGLGGGDVNAGSRRDRNAQARMHYSRWESEGGSGSVVGSSEGSPRNRIPDGCPTTAEEAASGTGGGSNPREPDDRLELVITTESDLAEYLVELDAEAVEPGDDADTHDHEYQDRAFEHDGLWYVHGYTAGGGDNYHVEDGEILRVGELQGSSQISVDGDELDIDDFDEIESVPSDDNDEYRTLEVAGQYEYRIEVDGEIEPTEEHAQWLTEGEAYGDDWAEWWLSGNDGARTVWKFTGEITTLEIDDHDGATEIRTLAVDGEELDHDEFVNGPSTLAVAGQFTYRIEVDGRIQPADEHAQWLVEDEAYGDDWAEWWLSGGENARTVWIIDGEITTLEITDHEGEREIRTLELDGTEIDPDSF